MKAGLAKTPAGEIKIVLCPEDDIDEIAITRMAEESQKGTSLILEESPRYHLTDNGFPVFTLALASRK